jgi:penicillin-binding protein 1A
VLGGTAGRSAINCPTAAKTGTTSELVDAWLDGYTPNYSTVVWMGYPSKRVSMTEVHGQPQQGGYLPAEIWHAYMGAVTEGKPCVPFAQPQESISFQPFYGKFAATGQSQAASEAEQEGGKKKRPRGAGGAGRAAPGTGKPPTKAPGSPPPSELPAAGKTGGAAPG